MPSNQDGGDCAASAVRLTVITDAKSCGLVPGGSTFSAPLLVGAGWTGYVIN